MDSVHSSKKRVIRTIFLLMMVVLSLIFTDGSKSLEGVKIYGKISMYENNKLNIYNNYGKAKHTNELIPITDKKNIEREILSAVNTNVTMLQVSLGGECYGYVSKQEEGKKILNKVGQIHLEKSNINKEKIVEIDVEGKIDYIPALASSSNLNDADNIAQRIYDDNNKLVTINIKVVDEEKSVISPEVKQVETDQLYIGESKIVEGKPGEKSVLKEIKYTNGERTDEKALNEKITRVPEDKIVYKGVKDPIKDEYAFLYKPTRGWTVTSNFGPRWGRNHNGMDIAGNIGDPVVATFDGVVKQKYFDRGYGNVIFLEHENGIETIYGHLNGFNIEDGQKVKKGDLIGFVGNTGNSTGPHLHFELRVNGNAVDPQKYIE